ncbi:MAG: hypothetical protein PQJ61_09905 [Spirochaetales bacterium]|uniref:Uncharacterized protein n=1 Tax=Candidatus Thalassospirochaeta sargassi TaxID=3119039 RepID=A0AAJ1ID16_9SPIO|nr:hypothetical protein [Spirochaetales bacterium]
MKVRKHRIFYIILVVLMIIDVYSIFNAGNPNSIIRNIVPDPGWDFLITAIISLLIVVNVGIMSSLNGNATDPVYLSLLENKAYIEKLREKGKNDQEIALSFISKLNESNLGKKIAYRKAIKYLKRI